MKRSAQFWLIVLFISFFSIPVFAQEDNENAGMPVTDIDGNVYRVIMTESGVWIAVSTGKICPKGWHVATEEEWHDLMDYAGTNQKSGDNPAKLKEKGTAHWKAPNTGATNEIFFNALPAGEVSYFNTDAELGTMTDWWTSTEDSLSIDPNTKKAANSNIVGLKYDFNSKPLGTYQKESALPVRCKSDD